MQKFMIAFVASLMVALGPVTVAVIAASGHARAADTNWHLYVDLTGAMAGRYEIVVDPPYTTKEDCEADADSEDTAQDLTAILHMAKHIDPNATVTHLRCEQGAGAPL